MCPALSRGLRGARPMSPTRPALSITTRPQPAPFPGLSPYCEADAARFLGRESELREIDSRLSTHGVVVLHEASGRAKPSFSPRRSAAHLATTGRGRPAAARPCDNRPGVDAFGHSAANVAGHRRGSRRSSRPRRCGQMAPPPLRGTPPATHKPCSQTPPAALPEPGRCSATVSSR